MQHGEYQTLHALTRNAADSDKVNDDTLYQFEEDGLIAIPNLEDGNPDWDTFYGAQRQFVLAAGWAAATGRASA